MVAFLARLVSRYRIGLSYTLSQKDTKPLYLLGIQERFVESAFLKAKMVVERTLIWDQYISISNLVRASEKISLEGTIHSVMIE